MISNLEMSFLVLIIAATMAVTLRRKLRRLDTMVMRREKLANAVKEQSVYIRNTARGTLHLRRSYKIKTRIVERLEAKLEDVDNLVNSITELDCRIHVLDDRRTRTDLSWVAVIKHSDFRNDMLPAATDELNRQWRVGYRFVIWAPDREKALSKIEHRYPSIGGFVVTTLEHHDESS